MDRYEPIPKLGKWAKRKASLESWNNRKNSLLEELESLRGREELIKRELKKITLIIETY